MAVNVLSIPVMAASTEKLFSECQASCECSRTFTDTLKEIRLLRLWQRSTVLGHGLQVSSFHSNSLYWQLLGAFDAIRWNCWNCWREWRRRQWRREPWRPEWRHGRHARTRYKRGIRFTKGLRRATRSTDWPEEASMLGLKAAIWGFLLCISNLPGHRQVPS